MACLSAATFFPFLVGKTSVRAFVHKTEEFLTSYERHRKSHVTKGNVMKQMRTKVAQIGEDMVSTAFSSDFFGYKSFTVIICQPNP